MFPSTLSRDLAAGRAPFVSPLSFFELVTRPSVEPTPETNRDTTTAVARATRVRTLVDQHFSFVWRYLRGLGVPSSEVDDAAQQVFVIASQKVDAIQEGSERSFLVGTARGVAANARRADVRRRDLRGDVPVDTYADDKPDAQQNAETREELAVLDRFLTSLPDDLREVFVLFELEGLTMAAIADALALPPGTVASRLRRAREEFQEMAKRFQATRAGALARAKAGGRHE